MTADETPAGYCPECGTLVPQNGVLIVYERADGRKLNFSECPGCREVVHPTWDVREGATISGP